MSRRLEDVRLAVMMLDGLEIAGRTHVVALGISTDGVRISLGLWEGSTENATLARTLLAAELERSWPDAAASLREGMDDTLTLMRLGITRLHQHQDRPRRRRLLPDPHRAPALTSLRSSSL